MQNDDNAHHAPRDNIVPTAEQIRVFQDTWWVASPSEATPHVNADHSTVTDEVRRMLAGEQIEMKTHIEKLLKKTTD